VQAYWEHSFPRAVVRAKLGNAESERERVDLSRRSDCRDLVHSVVPWLALKLARYGSADD
jgi:hypothetical protein